MKLDHITIKALLGKDLWRSISPASCPYIAEQSPMLSQGSCGFAQPSPDEESTALLDDLSLCCTTLLVRRFWLCHLCQTAHQVVIDYYWIIPDPLFINLNRFSSLSCCSP